MLNLIMTRLASHSFYKKQEYLLENSILQQNICDRKWWHLILYHFLGSKIKIVLRTRPYFLRGGFTKELYPILNNAWKVFAQKNHHPANDIITKAIQGLVSKKRLHQVAILIQQQQQPILLPSGWEDHAIACLFWKKYFIICNRGERPLEQKKHITAYRIDPSKITPLLLKQIRHVGRESCEDKGKFLFTELPKILMSEKDDFCKKLEQMQPSEQKNANCIIANMKQAIRVLLLCEKDKGSSYYKSFTIFARSYALELYAKASANQFSTPLFK